MSAHVCVCECVHRSLLPVPEMQNEGMTQRRALQCLNEQVPILLCS